MKNNFGIYTVNGIAYTDKIQAILEASRTKTAISWDYHQSMFKKINWWEEPEQSLDELYKIRAHQIRDAYDYVVVMFSGGADSSNVVHSFLSNNIKIDEIVSSIPESGLRDWKVSTDTSPENNASEWILTTLPKLNKIKTDHPEIKISINDFFKTMLEYKPDEWLYQSGDWLHPSAVARYKLDQLTHLKDLAEQGKRIALIYGNEKPFLSLYRGMIVSSIWDLGTNTPRQPFDFAYPNVDNILFYSAPELPQIHAKQSHIIAKIMYLPENKHILAQCKDLEGNYTQEEKNAFSFQNSVFQRAIVPYIYPSINMVNVFQAHKADHVFMASHDEWFYKYHMSTKTYEMIKSDFFNFYKTIDRGYMSKIRLGFQNFANHYTIGEARKFEAFARPL